MARRRKRSEPGFNLAFLDIMSCGFGAVILLFLMLAFFATFIIFLDQKLVRSSVSTPAEKADQDRTKPTIDFYSVLPDRKVEIPVSEEEQKAIKNPSINKTSGDKFLLQAGSMQWIEIIVGNVLN